MTVSFRTDHFGVHGIGCALRLWLAPPGWGDSTTRTLPWGRPTVPDGPMGAQSTLGRGSQPLDLVGVSAGMYMAIAVIAPLLGDDDAMEAVAIAELDPTWDPFAPSS